MGGKGTCRLCCGSYAAAAPAVLPAEPVAGSPGAGALTLGSVVVPVVVPVVVIPVVVVVVPVVDGPLVAPSCNGDSGDVVPGLNKLPDRHSGRFAGASDRVSGFGIVGWPAVVFDDPALVSSVPVTAVWREFGVIDNCDPGVGASF